MVESLEPMRLFRGGGCLAPLINSSPYPLAQQIPETIIHIPHSDQHTPGGLGLELSNVVD